MLITNECEDRTHTAKHEDTSGSFRIPRKPFATFGTKLNTGTQTCKDDTGMAPCAPATTKPSIIIKNENTLQL